MQHQPATVPQQAKQAGEVRARWAWAEASVWTDRMLDFGELSRAAALENGVKGDVWFSLIDKVYNPKNLWAAWSKSARNKGAAGVDAITTDQYEREAEANLKHLSEQLKLGHYQP